MDPIGRTIRLAAVFGAVVMLAVSSLALTGCSPDDDGDDGDTTEETTDAEPVELRIYFISAGENALAVTREVTVSEDADLPTVAMEELLAGMTADEEATWPALDTEIPPDTELLGTTTDGDIVTVDLSSEFEEGASSSAQTLFRVAQVVYTLTDLDGIDAVVFHIDGEPVTEFGGQGLDLSGPQAAGDYEDSVPIDA